MDKNLLVRATSAIVVIALLYVVYTIFNKTGLIYSSLIIVFLGSNEFSRMFFKDAKPLIYFFNFICLMSLVLFFTLAMSPFIYMSLVFIVAFILFHYRHSKNTDLQLKTIALFFTGYFYTLVLPFFIVKILSIHDTGLILFFCTLMITFTNDVFAYFTGRLFGKDKILPNISPKKTIAGSVGGLVFAAIASYFLLSFQYNFVGAIPAICVGVLCSIAAQAGDFFASLLKRVSNVKDSGKIMPGHGGVIDRLDGVYFVAPIFYGLYYLFFI